MEEDKKVINIQGTAGWIVVALAMFGAMELVKYAFMLSKYGFKYFH